MTTPARRALIAAAALLTLAATAACGSSGSGPGEPAKQGANSASPQGGSPKGDDGGDDAGPASSDPASKEFCNRYDEYMREMREGGSAAAAAALPKLDALMASPPDEFRQWASDVAPWVKAQVRDDSAAINDTAAAAEDASYEISNRCQFVLADM